MKQLLSLAISVILGIMILGGCGPQANEPNKETARKVTISHSNGEWFWPILDEITAEYKKLSGVEVEFIYLPPDGAEEWKSAHFAAGEEPDGFWGLVTDELRTYYNSGKIISLTDAYNSPSRYSGKLWKDDYIDGVLDGCLDDSGRDYIACPFTNLIFSLYYNKDIFDELGLEVPKNWSQMFESSQVIKDAGYIPMGLMNKTYWNLGWISETVIEDVYTQTDIASKLDIITPNGVVDLNEAVLGMKTGVLRLDLPAFVTFFKIIKDMVPYLNTGFNVASFEYESLFNEQKAAMQLNGSWYPSQHRTGQYTNNYGATSIPYVDSAINPQARNKPVRYMAGAGNPDVVITKKAEIEGRSDDLLGFLQFISDPNSGGKLWAEKTLYLPVIKDVDLPAEVQQLADLIGDEPWVFRASKIMRMEPEAYARYTDAVNIYLEDDRTPEQFAKEIHEMYESYIDEIIASTTNVDINSYIDKVKK